MRRRRRWLRLEAAAPCAAFADVVIGRLVLARALPVFSPRLSEWLRDLHECARAARPSGSAPRSEVRPHGRSPAGVDGTKKISCDLVVVWVSADPGRLTLPTPGSSSIASVRRGRLNCRPFDVAAAGDCARHPNPWLLRPASRSCWNRSRTPPIRSASLPLPWPIDGPRTPCPGSGRINTTPRSRWSACPIPTIYPAARRPRLTRFAPSPARDGRLAVDSVGWPQ